MTTDPSDPDAFFDEGADLPDAVGVVATTGRGSMPFAMLHGEPLVQVSSWALQEAGISLVDFDTRWGEVQGWNRSLVLHDPLCPLTPPDFLREALQVALDAGRPLLVVGSHSSGGAPRVTSPVILSAPAVELLEDWPDLDDFAAIVDRLADRIEVHWVEAPEKARRVEDEQDLAALEVTPER